MLPREVAVSRAGTPRWVPPACARVPAEREGVGEEGLEPSGGREAWGF